MCTGGFPMRRNVLLLQGPVGPFFKRLSHDLEQRGFNVFKVNFNGGDQLFSRRRQRIDYTGKLKYWGPYLERLIQNRDIGRIYLFGDCRAYHRIAKEVAARNGVQLFVFEEGYIRPDYLTLEENGVNGHSPMMIDRPEFEGASETAPPSTLRPERVFIRTAMYSILYYIAAFLMQRKYRFYQHHRRFNPIPEGYRWLVSAFRKWRYARKERNFFEELLPQFEDNYFVCPLQVHCDMQVAVHSSYNSIEHFIGEVVASFAEHAPPNKALVFKHHPMDRGYTDYSLLFSNLVSEYGLQGRIFYVHDICLPTLLKNAQGTVLINSTVGMSSMFHGTPVKTLGRAIYNQPGLVFDGPLANFWQQSGIVDEKLFDDFRAWLITHNQLNGSFYRRLPGVATQTGVLWSSEMMDAHSYDESRPVRTTPQLKVVGGRDVTTNGKPYDGDVDSLDVA